MRIILLEEAEEDLAEAMSFFEGQSDGLGTKFKIQVDEALGRILDHPKSWPKYRKGFRLCQLKDFRRHGILYRVGRTVIFVHGIINLQRGPRFWKNRL